MTDDKDRIIYELWKLLDNIDTLSDQCKDDYEGFNKLVYKEQQKRWKIIEEDFVDELYVKYFGDHGYMYRESKPKEEKE